MPDSTVGAATSGAGFRSSAIRWLRIALFASALPQAVSGQTFNDSRFVSELVTSVAPFTPVGLDWSPDGRMFIWTKNGVVRVFKNGVLLPTPFINLSSQVNTFDDRGMWGLAFHPDFANNGYVYLSFTYENAGNPNSSDPRTSRLIRVTANPSNPDVALAGSQVIILGSIGTPPCSQYAADADCIPADGGSHTLGMVRFAPDGKMFVGIGDGSDGDPLALRAQDIDSWAGKILRLNADGTAPGDNPFDDSTQSIRSKVWVYGVRNPFRFSFHPTTGEIYFGEVGWNTYEEVNRGSAGANFGWPCYEGDLEQPVFSGFTQCQQLARVSVTFPFFTYGRNLGAAAIGGAFYTGTNYPEAYRGSYFFADYVGNWIRRVGFDASGNPTDVLEFASDLSAPSNVELGPDGNLYYISFSTGQIRRIRFNGPKAVASATPTSGSSPLQVAFSSAGSTDPSGGTLLYLWDFGDGASSTSPNPSHTYTASGVAHFTATLTVTSTSGASASATVSITVGSRPPVPTISAPADGTTYRQGQTVNYQGSATDPDQGALPPSALSWTVLLHHNTHVHTFVGSSGSSQGSFVVEDHGIGNYAYEVILTATDASGLTGTTSVLLPVAPDSNPPSAPTGLVATPLSGSQIRLNWGASSDDVAILSYQVERCQGASCSNFTPLVTTAETTHVDPGLAPLSTYRYRVRAMDTSGNFSTYSNVATATTEAAPPVSGLVAAYGFNEGSGTTVGDQSGNGNTGSISGAVWAQGKYGNALSFDGLNDLVVINGASSTSLNVTSGMTLEAWVYPTAAQSGWRTILQREVDTYFLNGSSDAGALHPAGGAVIGGNVRWIGAPAPNPVTTWTHVALTYDGSTLQLYVNGSAVASGPASGAVQTNANPLRIGGNVPYGEFFNGRIDEVRVYNRALSASEIMTDMNTPIGGAPPADTTAPTAPTGLNGTAVGSNQIDLTWTGSTDNVGVSGYRVERCQGSSCSNFVQITTTVGTSYVDPGLTPATSYRYRVAAVDAAGNVSGYSNVVTVTTNAGQDTTPPSAPTALTASGVSSSQINLSWTGSTDNVGVSGYRLERCQGTGCSNFVQVATPVGTTFNDGGRTASTSYSYRVRAADAAGNLSAYSNVATATTSAAPDTTPPTPPTGLSAAAASSSQINLSWTGSTDNIGVTTYRVERCQAAGCSNFAEITTATTTSYANSGLAPSTSYSYRVRAADAAGNHSGYSNVATATTPSAPPVSGLMAAYAFNEASGATVSDASGNGNTGTINGATRTTQGRYGSALSFDGLSNLVVINASSTLNVTSAMTLEAWVFPTVAQSGWRTILQREVDAYFLNAGHTGGSGWPAGGGTLGGNVTFVGATAANPLNTWTHVALTYDGSLLRLYVNGNLVASQPASGTIQTNSSPLRIGGNVPYGEFFGGLIDEVRIYNRALSQAEIQTDMNTPIN
jgi:glucose/arabinose dehydrogenase/chitodextrinase